MTSAARRRQRLKLSENDMAAEFAVTLSAQKSKRFLKELNTPFRANSTLKKALARVGA
jgi:uncharacterized protein (DUF1778 family)